MGNEAEEQKRRASEHEGAPPDIRGNQPRGRFVLVLPDQIVQRRGGRPKNEARKLRILAIRAAFVWRTEYLGSPASEAYDWISELWPMPMYRDESNVRKHIAEAKRIAPWGLPAKHGKTNFYLLAPRRLTAADEDEPVFDMPDPKADGWIWELGETQVDIQPGAGRVLAERYIELMQSRLASLLSP